MRRSTRHLVMAREDLPAKYRPGNQMRLERSRAANATPGDPQDFLPGLGDVQSGNGRTDNGLGRKGSMDRFQHALAEVHAQRMAKTRGGWLSRPTSTKVPTIKVILAWAGNSIFAERQKIIDAFGLIPLASWNKRESYTTTAWGTNTEGLLKALQQQPIVSTIGAEVLGGKPVLVAHDVTIGGTNWEFVATIARPIAGERWVITRRQTPSGTRFAATLYRKTPNGEDELIRSDNLANEITAREYIRSYEVEQGDYGAVGKPKRVAFWNTIQRRFAPANAAPLPANARPIQFVPSPAPQRPGSYQPSGNVTNLTPHEIREVELQGLGALATGPLLVAGMAIAGIIMLAKNR